MIELLQRLAPGPARSERVVARCHERLAQQRRRLERRRRGIVERGLLAALALVYVFAVAGDAMRVFAMF